MGRSTYSDNLLKNVIRLSSSNTWERAVLEWEVEDVEEDEYNESSCICGKENIRYLFKIRNQENGNYLFPIGSSCIRKFERQDLNEVTLIKEKLFKLYHAVKEDEFISLNREFFSRNLIRYLYENGAFLPTAYNQYNPENDFSFLMDMFNKKNEPTEKQKSKIRAIIVTSIRPFLIGQIERKINKKNDYMIY